MKIGRFGSASALVALALAAGTAQAVVVDGQRDAIYGSPIAVQDSQTSFGSGNSLAAAYCNSSGGNLNFFLSGTLGTGFEKLVLFVDTTPGGQNTIAGSPNTGVLGNIAGMTFDTGFNPDYMIQINGNGTDLYVDYADLNGAGSGYAGQTTYGSAGVLAGGSAAPGLLATYLNSGPGLPFGFGLLNPSEVAAASAYATGAEFSIPLALIGSPTGSFYASAFIIGGDGSTRSTQFLGGVGGGIATNDYSGLSGLNLNNIAGQQNFLVPAPGTMALLGLGGLLAARRRR